MLAEPLVISSRKQKQTTEVSICSNRNKPNYRQEEEQLSLCKANNVTVQVQKNDSVNNGATETENILLTTDLWCVASFKNRGIEKQKKVIINSLSFKGRTSLMTNVFKL